jgi:hypothetical protein
VNGEFGMDLEGSGYGLIEVQSPHFPGGVSKIPILSTITLKCKTLPLHRTVRFVNII